jgi:bacteriocin biosynthesis cyclodehydratase domain-containing protein
MNTTVFVAGSFGAAVADRLAGRVQKLTVRPLAQQPHTPVPALDAAYDEALSGVDRAAVIAWRRYPREFDRLDAACFRAGVPWTTVILEDNNLRCGPVIRPGRGPCHACYRVRWLAQSDEPGREETLDTVYSTHHRLGVHGYPPSSVSLAVPALLQDWEQGTPAGRVRWIDLLQVSLDEAVVVGVHGCDRCGQRRPPGQRYTHRLATELWGAS